MDWVTYIAKHRPDLVGQAQSHRRCPAMQGTVNPMPIVKIAPKPQGILQQTCRARHIAAATAHPSLLLRTYGSIEAFHMRGIDTCANPQLADQTLDVYNTSMKRLATDLHQVALRIPYFFDDPYLKSRRGFESGTLFATPTLTTTSMPDQTKDLENRIAIRRVIVCQQQRDRSLCTAHGYRRNQSDGRSQGPGARTKVDQKATLYRQSRMNPGASRFATLRRTLRRRPSAPFFSSPLLARPWSSSIWTAGIDCCSFSSCKLWKSSARFPACSSRRCTVRVSTSQISAVASMEQPCPKHLTIRTTAGWGSLLYCISEPCRSLKRVWQTLQYNRRMALFLPMCSQTNRLFSPNLLNAAHSGLGQAKNSRENGSLGGDCCFGFRRFDISGLLANLSYAIHNISAKRPQIRQFLRLSLPISCGYYRFFKLSIFCLTTEAWMTVS